MGLFYDRICENVIDKRVELELNSETTYLPYSDIAIAIISKDALEIIDCDEYSHRSEQSFGISQQVIKALVNEGFKKIKFNLFINPDKINFITLEIWVDRITLFENGNLNIELDNNKVRFIPTIYKSSLKMGIPVMLRSTFPVSQIREYKNYILKFKEKYPEKLLLYELNWKDDKLFDYNILL